MKSGSDDLNNVNWLTNRNTIEILFKRIYGVFYIDIIYSSEYRFVIDFLTFELVNILNPGNTWYTRTMQ